MGHVILMKQLQYPRIINLLHAIVQSNMMVGSINMNQMYYLQIIFFSWLGVSCELSYDGCTSGSACQINWNDETTCIPLNATQQIALNRAYICNGTCENGYYTTDNVTCQGMCCEILEKIIYNKSDFRHQWM